MDLNELIADLRVDLSDPDASLFQDVTLDRCIRKAVYRVSGDLDMAFTIIDGQIQPDVNEEIKELFQILGHIHACQVMRSATANAFSFSSGDKRVDKSKQPEHWAKLEADLLADYRKRLAFLKSDMDVNEEAYIIKPTGLQPVIYEQGVYFDEEQ